MKCPNCRAGETRPGTATLVLERAALTMVVRHVPAEACANPQLVFQAATDRHARQLGLDGPPKRKRPRPAT